MEGLSGVQCPTLLGFAAIASQPALLFCFGAAPQPVAFVVAPGLRAPVSMMLVYTAAGIRGVAFRQGQPGRIFRQKSGAAARLNSFAALAFGLDGDGVPKARLSRGQDAVWGWFRLMSSVAFSGHWRAPVGLRVMQYRVQSPNQSRSINARVFDKLPI